MRLWTAAVLLISGCAWRAPGPGPTRRGLVVAVSAGEPAAARREAVASVLPLFLGAEARRDAAEALERVALAKPEAFTGRERPPKGGAGAVEVLLDRLSAALQSAGLASPRGFPLGPETTLIALGDPRLGPGAGDLLAAEALETALFGRGLQAADARDRLVELKNPIKAKTEEGIAAEAARGGWSWLVTGRTALDARRDAASGAWRGSARLEASVYELRASTAASPLAVSGAAVDMSSSAAIGRAVEAAAGEAAVRMDRLMARGRGGRSTIALLLAGDKDPRFVKRVIEDLRAVAGVAGASLIAWNGPEGMILARAYVVGLSADQLAARLLRRDPSLRFSGIEPEDGRLTVEGPAVPESRDDGGEL